MNPVLTEVLKILFTVGVCVVVPYCEVEKGNDRERNTKKNKKKKLEFITSGKDLNPRMEKVRNVACL